MITVNDISVQFGGTHSFSDVSFAINENDKIALMGKMEQESQRSRLLGKTVRKHICTKRGCGSLFASAFITDGATVMEEASKAFGEILE
jgi:ATP-binding cassette subfamily F protein 3